LPRRHWISAAGALAASLLFAASLPAEAQYATGQPLRGSIPPQDATQPAQGSSAPVTPGTSADATPKGPTLPVGGLPPLQRLPGETPTTPLGGTGDDINQVPGDEQIEGPPTDEFGEEIQPPAAVPEIGISTEQGEATTQIPGTQYDSGRHRILAPPIHDLDPYVPIGMKLGTFLLFTEAEIGTILTDNVLDTDFNEHKDIAFEFAPEVRLESNWARNFFMAQFTADRSWYHDFSVEDDKIYQALLRGRLDVTSRTHLELETEKSQTQVGRDSVSLTDISGPQTNLQEQHITASADHTFNRLTLRLTGTVADYDYGNQSPILILDPSTNALVPFQDIRDYVEDELRLRSTYELRPDTAVFLEGSLNNRNYKQEVNSAGFRRDSSGTTLVAGAVLNFTDRLTGEISAGWGQQQSVDDRLSPVEGPLINADLIWLPSPLTKLEFIARSEIDDSSLTDSLGAIDHYYDLSLQHAFWRYLVLGTHISYEIADYVDDPLVDQRIKTGASAEYYFNPYASVYARYEYTDFFSTNQSSDFIENQVRLGFRIRH
jgi:hypothetical protein